MAYSDDAENWTTYKEYHKLGARMAHKTVTFNDKLWIVGGVDSSGSPKADVWSSEDGETRADVCASASMYAAPCSSCSESDVSSVGFAFGARALKLSSFDSMAHVQG